jgi:probable rRNA maturation factor
MTEPGDHPAILVSNRQPLPVDEPGLAALARSTLLAEGREMVEVSLSLVDEDEMTDLHRRYMNEDGPTDVLSFSMDESDDGVAVIGDVVIAPSVAAKNNPTDPEGELRLLVVHGVLHLLGYDHEHAADRDEMWARQERYSGVRAS